MHQSRPIPQPSRAWTVPEPEHGGSRNILWQHLCVSALCDERHSSMIISSRVIWETSGIVQKATCKVSCPPRHIGCYYKGKIRNMDKMHTFLSKPYKQCLNLTLTIEVHVDALTFMIHHLPVRDAIVYYMDTCCQLALAVISFQSRAPCLRLLGLASFLNRFIPTAM